MTARMRYGLLSDVHGNLPALDAALAALGRLRVDRYICAGDVVGYGPRPVECIERIARLDPVWVLGNHELMLLGTLPTADAPALARRTLEWTRSVLPPAAEALLRTLPTTAEAGASIVVTHGSLADPLLRVRSREQVAAELSRLGRDHTRARFLVLGHTHRVMVDDGCGGVGWRRLRSRVALDGAARYVVNPGSVGQSRGFLNRARAAVLDTAANTIQLVGVQYDTAALVYDLAALGFPRWTYHRSPLRRFAGRVRGKARTALARRWIDAGRVS